MLKGVKVTGYYFLQGIEHVLNVTQQNADLYLQKYTITS